LELSVAVRLIEQGVEKTPEPQRWADLGAGKGLFTEALAKLLAPKSIVYALDRDENELKEVPVQSGDVVIKPIKKDFVREQLGLEKLDGILMANSLHFVKEAIPFLAGLKKQLNPGGRVMLIEYDRESATPWVPFPISFNVLKTIYLKAGFTSLKELDHHPSVFNRVNIYSALIQ
jgi:ubiquinone/menaquinone biosynthesis C-methylase UbiE